MPKEIIFSARISPELAAQIESVIAPLEKRSEFIITAMKNEMQRRNEPTKALARKTDPDTSKQAAAGMVVNKMERFVLGGISTEGSTIDEIMQELMLQGPGVVRYGSVSTRIAPLIRKGYVMDTGETRKGSSGRNQRIVRRMK